MNHKYDVLRSVEKNDEKEISATKSTHCEHEFFMTLNAAIDIIGT
jgi:hypothetical protein